MTDKSEPRAYIRLVEGRWRSWVQDGAVVFEQEFGTWSLTEKRARKKALRLLTKYTHTDPPAIDVTP